MVLDELCFALDKPKRLTGRLNPMTYLVPTVLYCVSPEIWYGQILDSLIFNLKLI